MTRSLRFLMLALLSAVFNVSFAQEVSLDFAENTWGLPEGSKEKAIDAAQFSNGTYSITLQGSEDGGYYHNTGYLLLGKEGAKLTLPKFNFDVEKIVVSGTSGASASVKQNIFVGDTPVSTETAGAKNVDNEYDIAEAYQAAGTVYTLKVLSGHNTQVSRIDIYKKGTSTPTKPTPEISFEPNAISVMLGESVTEPTLTYTGDGEITYTSSNEQVAKVEAKTGALTILNAGTATIKATAAETDNYKSASATYSLTVKGQQPDLPTDAIWAENWQQAAAGTLVEDVSNPSATYIGDGQYVKLYGATSDETNIELLVPKNSRGVTFQANVNLGGKSGNLTLTYYSNKPLDVTTTTQGVTIAEPYAENNIYKHLITVPSGTSVLNLTFATKSDANARLDDIVLTESSGQDTKQMPSIAFSASTLSVILGDAVTPPTLTYSGDGTITYASNNEAVASVNAVTGALTINGIGSATISATSSETDKFLSATAHYNLIVTSGTPTEAIWSEDWQQAEAGTLVEEVPNPSATYKGDGQYVKLYAATSDDTNNELLVPKNSRGATFQADVNLGGKSGNLTLTYYSNKPLDVTTTTGGVAIGEPTVADNIYTHSVSVPAGTSVLNLTFATKTDVNARLDNITLTEGGGSVEKTLTISGATSFTTSTTVTITPSNDDFIVYYTLDGSEPGQSSTSKTYSGPFVLTETTTVKAVEEDYAGELSAMVMKTFVKEEAPEIVTVNNIAEFKALPDKTEATLMLENAEVLYNSGTDIYIRDESGAIDFYNTGLEPHINAGYAISGSVTGISTNYNGIPELTKSSNTNDLNLIANDNWTVRPKNLTIAQAKNDLYLCDLIKFTDVYLASVEKGGTTSIYAYVGKDSLLLYDRFKEGFGQFEPDKTYNVYGILVLYKGDYELYITQSVAPNVMQTCNNIEEFVNKANDREMNLILNNAQVVYASGNDAYVRDATGAIDFFKIGFELKTNQILNGSVIGMGTMYRGTPEITNSSKTNADDITITDGPEAEPIVTTIAKLIRNYTENGKSVSYKKTFCNLVQIENVQIEEEQGKLYAVDGNDRIRVYDKFKLVGEDLKAGVTATIKGIHLLYENGSSSELQIMPITYTITSNISDVSGEGIATGPAYNMAGQRVGDNFKGVVIQGGHKYIRR